MVHSPASIHSIIEHIPEVFLKADSNRVYTTGTSEEDLIRTLEPGPIWISYNRSLISARDRAVVEYLFRFASPKASGAGVGVILKTRTDSSQMVALVFLGQSVGSVRYDPATFRKFIKIKCGKALQEFTIT